MGRGNKRGGERMGWRHRFGERRDAGGEPVAGGEEGGGASAGGGRRVGRDQGRRKARVGLTGPKAKTGWAGAKISKEMVRASNRVWAEMETGLQSSFLEFFLLFKDFEFKSKRSKYFQTEFELGFNWDKIK